MSAAGSWAGPAWFWLAGGTRVVGGGWGGRARGPGPAWGLGKATYCQAKLPTVRQAKTVRQAPNRSIDLHPTSAYFAPKRFRIHAPKCFIDMHPKSAYMHPRVSAYMHLIRMKIKMA